ncbi:hypothetical protein ACFQE5_11600 [Pseudonocardia hispaniensis]|uniref:Uncharacterized protein n=1 Tax=Pseudonocardia hispaniensis TaxID=904933 RepID=A0ABW1J214_9PSEU
MGTRAPWRPLRWFLLRTGLHRHRADPDLSALLAFPACRCGVLLWPTAQGSREPARSSRPALGGPLRRSSRRG